MQNKNNKNFQRLNKAIAECGICSRRKADFLIKNKKIKVNGIIIDELGYRVSVDDDISIDGEKIERKNYKYLLVNKPRGYLSTTLDDQGRKIILDLLPEGYRNLKIVGRLDRDSDGLVILSNDGDFIQGLQHPKNNIKKTYIIGLYEKLNIAEINNLKKHFINGISYENIFYKAIGVDEVSMPNNSDKKHSYIQVVLHEGKNRQIRKMFQAIGLKVKSLKRIKIGGFKLEDIRKGHFKEITKNEAYANCK